jgi:hypothetical protein
LQRFGADWALDVFVFFFPFLSAYVGVLYRLFRQRFVRFLQLETHTETATVKGIFNGFYKGISRYRSK